MDITYIFYVQGVNPSQHMLDLLKKVTNSNPNIETVCMNAVEFSQSTQYSPYDRILLKSMLHFLTHEERLIAFEGFYKQLAPKNGKLLIVNSPNADEILPFDDRTKKLMKKY